MTSVLAKWVVIERTSLKGTTAYSVKNRLPQLNERKQQNKYPGETGIY